MLKIQVCKSGAGYYVGQLDKDGSPYSRLSCSYYPTREECEAALHQGFEVKYWAENEKLVTRLIKKMFLLTLQVDFPPTPNSTLICRVP